MAYQIKRSQKTIEQLDLVDSAGSVKTIDVRLDADGLVEKVSKKYMDLLNAQKEASELNVVTANPEKVVQTQERLGNVTLALFEAVFGEEDTKTILDFYDGNTIEMIQAVVPFIVQVVIPEIRKISQENRKQAMQSYARKKTRLFGK